MSKKAFDQLIDYCREQDWQGHDPYDGLNSSIYASLPDSKLLRIALIQFCKRSPFNLRQLLKVPAGENAKGLGLFARALLLAYCKTGNEQYRRDSEELLERLWTLRSPGYDEKSCWGYNFDWQSRAFFVPKGTPSIVCTTFIAHAWIDYYQLFGDQTALDIARSACQFILEDLPRHTDESDPESFCFSYTPVDRSQVHNANLLGAELLARVAGLTHEVELIKMALQSARFTVKRQDKDGCWPYGTAANQQWRDNFHTGFNLVSLATIIKECNVPEWQSVLSKGMDFYRRAFFLADGRPKYYDNKLYPIDIHSAAQAIVTFVRLREEDPQNSGFLARVLDWTLHNMQDVGGYFYFQRTAYGTNKIPYMRWSQAWMAYALSLANFDQARDAINQDFVAIKS